MGAVVSPVTAALLSAVGTNVVIGRWHSRRMRVTDFSALAAVEPGEVLPAGALSQCRDALDVLMDAS